MAQNKDAVRKALDKVKADGRTALTAPEGKLVCDAYGIPVPKEGVAGSADYDLAVAASEVEIPEADQRRWSEPTAWGMASPAIAEADGPVPLLVVGESSLSRRLSVALSCSVNAG